LDGAGSFGPELAITTTANGASSVHTADLDGDGDMDVLSASLYDDTIAWYENTDGAGSYGPQRVITAAADYAQDVYAADLDGDGDVDVLSASSTDDTIAWYENTDGVGSFGVRQLISTAANNARSVYAEDLDGDEDADVLSASWSDGTIAWYVNGPDGVGDACDNCLDVANSDQADADGNGVGDACNDFEDIDGDDFADGLDNCPGAPNADQVESDGDGLGDACDNCPGVDNLDQSDGDGDGVGDVCDNCMTIPNADQIESDGSTNLLVSGDTGLSHGYSYGGVAWPALTSAIDDACASVTVVNNFEYPTQMLHYGAIWLDQRWTDGALSANEQANIAAYIASGRRAVMIGENSSWTNWNNQILGIVGGSYTGINTSGYKNAVGSHDLLDGVSRVYVATGGLANGGESLFDANWATLWEDNALTILDVNAPSSSYWHYGDNDVFFTNVANWVCEGYSGPLGPDGLGDACDNCPFVPNADQTDADSDGLGDACDNCPDDPNADQADTDANGVGDACNDSEDVDGDEFADDLDNCPGVANPDQTDTDGDGAGDACDPDDDDDGVLDEQDNCRITSNPDQSDVDGDTVGDACDNCAFVVNADQSDQDLDGWGDVCDNCPVTANSDQSDVDGNGVGDACNDFEDVDGDDFADGLDNCPDTSNPDQSDLDGNGVGDACNDFEDVDGDDFADGLDNCPDTSNTGQSNVDGDSLGDACDNCPGVDNLDQSDVDGDGVGDVCDNCATVPNPDQIESDAVSSVLWVGPRSTEWNDGSADVAQIGVYDLATIELSGFKVIYVDEAAGGLSTLLGRAADIADFVAAGGGLITENGGSDGNPDFSWVPNASDLAWVEEHQSSVSLTALGHTHPVTAGLTDQGLSNWNDSQHNHFTQTAGMDVLATNPAGFANILAGAFGSGRLVYLGLDPSGHQPRGHTRELIRQSVIWARGSVGADGYGDACDNCPAVPNPDQSNWDGDGDGDACDTCPGCDLDIKPGGCPNSMNRTPEGILTVALTSAEGFDPMQIDFSTIVLSRVDGTGGSVPPQPEQQGPPPFVLEDIATIFDGGPCDCHELEGDGLVDVQLKFRNDQLVPELDLLTALQGTLLPLEVSGEFLDGTPFSATDCVRLTGPAVVVESTVEGLWLEASPPDAFGTEGGYVPLGLSYPAGGVVTLTAPTLFDGWIFQSWMMDGVELTTEPTVEVTITSEFHMLVPVYQEWTAPEPPIGRPAPRDDMRGRSGIAHPEW
jgi:hypothetical protein